MRRSWRRQQQKLAATEVTTDKDEGEEEKAINKNKTGSTKK
jgi:hypothetical protein